MVPLLAFYQSLLDELNYFSLTVLMALESSIFPVPSELVVPPAAYMAAEGRMTMAGVLFFSTLGCMIGASANYLFSYVLGRPVIYAFANSRVGHILLLSEDKLSRAEHYFNRRGEMATLVGRLLPVIRHLISIPAGVSRMHYGRFLLYTALGSAIWNGILAALGWYFQRVVPYDQLQDKVHEYERPILWGIVSVVAALILYFVMRHIKSRKTKQV